MQQQTSWTLLDHKKSITIQAQKLTLFQQCKIIEAADSQDQHYLLFFYKDCFITAQPVVDFTRVSFLGQAKSKGFHIYAPNPLFSKLLPSLSTVKKTPIPQLLHQIKKQYSVAETALISSYFDSYIAAEHLETLLKDFFFTYRRDGKLLTAYHLAKILLSRGYKQEWLLASIKHPDYTNAVKRYQASLSELLTINPIYVEQQYFLNTDSASELLMVLYEQQSRTIDSVILETTKWLKQASARTYPTFIKKLSASLKEEDILPFLYSLLPAVSPASSLHQDIYQRLMKKQEYEAAVHLLLSYSIPLSANETKQLPAILERSSNFCSTHSLHTISNHLFPLFTLQPQQLEAILQSKLPQLLQHHHLLDLHSWLQESELTMKLSISKKLADMVNLINDPDRQLELGCHYLDLLQYEQAIECFQWEMELNPGNLEPVQQLMKASEKLGRQKEVETYQHLLKQIQKST
jgi:tetratricopeptide (TPR) repeat protein